MVDHAPLNTPQSTTILSSVRLDGEVAFTIFQGGTTGDKFLTYLKDVLIPTLHPGDIVVMDNLRTHHIQAVGELLHGAGAEVLYLPPYSPDLNPIEKLWSKVKAILRKLRVRSPDALDDAIHFALNCVSAADCVGWCWVPVKFTMSPTFNPRDGAEPVAGVPPEATGGFTAVPLPLNFLASIHQ